MINARVFFWLDPDRLNRQKAACEPRPQVVMIIDADALVAGHEEQVAVTPINTGNARRKPARRGAATFVPFAEWLSSGWASEAAALGIPLRKRSHRPVELTVEDAVPDIMRYVVGLYALPAGQPFEISSGVLTCDMRFSVRMLRMDPQGKQLRKPQDQCPMSDLTPLPH
jgi:hypothetical protein